MQAGAGLFSQIKAFNDKTPFSLDDLTQATNVLLAAKVPLADLQSQLAKFGDLSQGNAQRFASYVNAFSKAAAKGKADMEVLNAYLNQGVPILDALAARFGVATAEIVEMTSQGKIGFEDFSAALNDLTAKGGQYFGGMELGSRSLAAMQEGLKEATASLAASFGEMLLPAAIDALEALTAITNAVNESPIAKGVLAGALVALTGHLAAMAVKAGVAFAAQMKLNLAVGALNPVVAAATVAAGLAAAGYAVYASKQQQAAREAENFALQQRQQKDAIDESAAALERYALALAGMTDEQLRYQIEQLNAKNNASFRITNQEELQAEAARLEALYKALGERRASFIDSMFSGSQAGKIQKINDQLAAARKHLTDPGVSGDEKTKLQEIIAALSSDLEKRTSAAGKSMGEIDRAASRWKAAWADVWEQFQAEQSGNPFALIDLEQSKREIDAAANYLGEKNQRVYDQINEYYAARRSQKAQELAEEEERLARELTETRVDDLDYELQTALENIDILEARRVVAAAASEAEITAVHERAAALRAATEAKYAGLIADAAAEAARGGANRVQKRLEEARQGVVDWQQALSDSLALALLDIGGFDKKAAVILGDLSAQFAGLIPSAALSGFEEFGRALGEGEDAADSMRRALVEMSRQILRQLPTLFLQAGLQLIANGQWPLGLGFIAAAGSAALVSGYVDGATAAAKKEAEQNARGGVYDEHGRAAVAFAAGGAFANRMVDRPTFFRFASGASFAPGVMGEAGPEAILPLERGPDGRLGVGSFGGAAAPAVYVVIQNYTGEAASEERSADASGNQIHKIIIGAVRQSIASGEMDRSLSGRYGLRARGV
jgi:tape measure domain-containing protein